VYISLYVYGPGDTAKDVPSASELLTVSVRCARAGIDGILYLASGLGQIRDFQKAAVDKVALRERLKSYGDRPVHEVLDIVKSWEKIVG